MSLFILIPCKRLAEGKSRLAPIMSPGERHALCRGLLTRTLSLALALRPAASIRVVTPDAEASGLAREHGVATIDDGGAELNEALARGRAAVPEGASALILPIDLPHASAEAIARLVRTSADVALAPDEERRGTNLLLLAARALPRFAFAYGPDSFAAHRRWAEERGFSVAVIEDRLLAFDIDRPEDYRRVGRQKQAP
jgi:2-phospho-L-lactate/phosphoenolpyruvate guanylyltransferase